jgi:hypothetical protein
MRRTETRIRGMAVCAERPGRLTRPWQTAGLVGCLMVGLLAATAGGAVTFFVNPDGQMQTADPNRDLAFQAALTKPFTEFDFAQFGHEYIMEPSPLFAGGVRVRPNLLDVNGDNAANLAANGNRLIETYPWADSTAAPGIIENTVLLNRTYAGGFQDVRGAAIEFTFDQPVEAFGAWMVDDSVEENGFVLKITEVGGAVSTSSLMDSGNSTALAVEGFLGAVSDVGITKAVLEQQTLSGTPSSDDFFYTDHVQIGGPMNVEICDNGIDDNGDGKIDCDDPQCFGKPGCTTEAACDDGLDNDADGKIDCSDPDCFGQTGCTAEALCADGLDNDADGKIDCSDSNCFGQPGCTIEKLCHDGLDNDGDGLVDGADPDCSGFTIVYVEAVNTLRDGSAYGPDGIYVDSNAFPYPPCGRYAEAPAWFVSKFQLSNFLPPGTTAADIAMAELSVPSTDVVFPYGPPTDPATVDFVLHHFETVDNTAVVTADYHTFSPALTDYGIIIPQHPRLQDTQRKVLVDVTAAIKDDLSQGRTLSCFRVGADPNGPYSPNALTYFATTDNGDAAFGPPDDPARRNVMKLRIGVRGQFEGDCANGVDDDGDGYADCADADCYGTATCPEIACSDGKDNDGDGLIDCADPDCFGESGCTVEKLCNDGKDNDADCLVDGADPDCRGDIIAYVPSVSPETLRDGPVYGPDGIYVDSNTFYIGYIGRYAGGLSWMVSKFKPADFLPPGTTSADISSVMLSFPNTDYVHIGSPNNLDMVLHHFVTLDDTQVTTADYHTYVPADVDYGIVIPRHSTLSPDCMRNVRVDVTTAVKADMDAGRAVSCFRVGADPVTTELGPSDLFWWPTADNADPCFGPVGDQAHRNVMKLIIKVNGKFESSCSDGVDNDGDGLVDCADADCYGDPACAEFEVCGDGIDNNGDGKTDCDDPQCAATPCCVGRCHTPPQDADGDGDVDLVDFLTFQTCFNGPNRPYAATLPECQCLDDDKDADVDLADFLVFQGCFNGPNRPAGCP